jgi:hypothetical protein
MNGLDPMNTETTLEPTYSTSDLTLIAFLLAMECKYLRAEKSPRDPQTVFVHFLDPRKCLRLEKKFHQTDPKMPIKTFLSKYSEARDIVFHEKRRPEAV